MNSRWRKHSKFSRFIKLKTNLSNIILLNVPPFAEALVLISKLLQEVTNVVFLPKDKEINLFTNLQQKHTKENSTLKILESFKQKQQVVKETYTMEKYMHNMYDLDKSSDQLLNYFFICVKYILDHTRVSLYDKIRFYEKVINADGPL